MRFRVSSEFSMHRARGHIRVLGHPRRALAVSVGACGFYPVPSPVSLRIRVHPLVSFPPLQSPFASRPPLPALAEAPSLGLCALFAASTRPGLLPFEGLRLEPAAPSVSPPAVLPLMRLAALQSIVCARLVGLFGSPTPAMLSPFPSELAVSTVRRPLLACANRFILS